MHRSVRYLLTIQLAAALLLSPAFAQRAVRGWASQREPHCERQPQRERKQQCQREPQCECK